MAEIDDNVKRVAERIEAGDEVVVSQPSRRRVVRFNAAEGGFLWVRIFHASGLQFQTEQTKVTPDRETLRVAVAEALYE